MATFIPEWVKVSGRNLHIKRVLNALDDDHVVRQPILQDVCPADFFIQHRIKGWLAVAIEEAPFEAIDPAQLFESEPRSRFQLRVAALQQLGTCSGQPERVVESLVLMWSCSTEEVRTLMNEQHGSHGIRLVSRELFTELGSRLIDQLLTVLPKECEQILLGTYFPEAEIPAIFTTRRSFHRDNSARLDRFFLDAEQEWASKLDLALPDEQANTAKDFTVRVVNGVAGSGKTLVALNRALMLAKMFPAQRLLILIFNTPIVADIKERLHRVGDGLPANLEIKTFFSWASLQWKNVFEVRPNMPSSRRMVPELVNQFRLQMPDIKYSDSQLISEMDFINESLIADEAGYFGANRAGRGFALNKKERSQAWALFQFVSEELRKSALHMWSAVPRELCLAEGKHLRLRKYHHILVDEAQFFAPSWFQVVKLSMENDAQLFLCADPNQGFMKNRLSWKRVGLDVNGRTKRLHKSYRTTKAVLSAASRVLAALGHVDGEDYLKPDFSDMREGSKPILIYTDSPQDALDRVVNEVVKINLHGKVPMNAMLVIYGENVQPLSLHHLLEKGIGANSVWWFNKDSQKKEPPDGYGKEYLRMAYLDTATGLEAGVVFLLGLESIFSETAVPGISDEEHAEQREEKSRKLYMAMTRAGDRLVLLSSQQLPAAMEMLFDVVA